jgi:hypothetical protein
MIWLLVVVSFFSRDVGKGTGLGLATIYGIVKQNNGFINVYSEPGQGSTFKIYLSRLVAEEYTDKAVPEKKTAAGGTETILLVEDEPSILRMTRMMLSGSDSTFWKRFWLMGLLPVVRFAQCLS